MEYFDLIKEFDEFKHLPESPEKVELNAYFENVKQRADNKDEEIFKNKGPLQAAFVMSALFLSAKEKIRIFAGNLNGEVSGKSIWRKSLESAFDCIQNLKIEVILQSEPLETSTGLQTLIGLRRKNPERVIISTLKPNTDPISGLDFHFTIVDDDKVRIETDIISYKALCSFHDPDMAAKLIDLFVLLRPISIPKD